jgi:hypothetical protein
MAATRRSTTAKNIPLLAPYDSIVIKQVNATIFTSTQKNSGTKYKTTSRAVISKDGKKITVNHARHWRGWQPD